MSIPRYNLCYHFIYDGEHLGYIICNSFHKHEESIALVCRECGEVYGKILILGVAGQSLVFSPHIGRCESCKGDPTLYFYHALALDKMRLLNTKQLPSELIKHELNAISNYHTEDKINECSKYNTKYRPNTQDQASDYTSIGSAG